MGSGFTTSASEAISDWNINQISGPQFTFNSCGSQPCPNPTTARDYGGVNPLTQTSVYFDGNGHINRYDQTVNKCSCISWYNGFSTIPSNQLDFKTNMRHEFGHALGLCHSTQPGYLMYFSLNYGEYRFIDTDAQNGAAWLYNPNFSSPVPDSGCS